MLVPEIGHFLIGGQPPRPDFSARLSNDRDLILGEARDRGCFVNDRQHRIGRSILLRFRQFTDLGNRFFK